MAALTAGVVRLPAAARADGYAIEITSPLGRSGLPGTVRIVARVSVPAGDPVPAVRFYVDDALLATDSNGPPFAAEWEDVNPFERARLRAEIDLPDGRVLDAAVELPSFDYVEEASVLSVILNAVVQDEKDRVVAGLSHADFLLYEDGLPQAIDSVTLESAPATFALLIDSSQSMSRSMEFVQRAAARLTGFLQQHDTVVVAPFQAGITTVTGPTRDVATIQQAIGDIAPNGGTAILDSLAQVTDRFGNGPGRRVVVLITDGYDEQSQGESDAILNHLRDSRVTVYVISIGGVAGVSIRGERLLRRIAEYTGGRAFFPWNARQLEEAHTAITEDVRHQYRLAYTPGNQEPDGTWRTITVETRHGTHRVRARPGYRAPAPPPVRASIEFTATDERQQLVELTREDLLVLEDGAPQEVDAFTEAVAPVSIVLALDGSGSMRRAAGAAREAAHAFVDALQDDDPLGVLVFADAVETAHDLSTRRELSHDAIEAYTTTGGTALYDAMAEAAERLSTVEGRRVIVVVTDGRDENGPSTGPGSVRTWDEALNALADAQATVYAIGLGANVDTERLQAASRLTGGEAYFTTDVAELELHYRRIIEELHRRYVIGYTSTNSRRDGSWRTVEIRTVNEGVRIRTRGGYYAPQR